MAVICAKAIVLPPAAGAPPNQEQNDIALSFGKKFKPPRVRRLTD